MKKLIPCLVFLVVIISGVQHQSGTNIWIINGCVRASGVMPCTLQETITISIDASQFAGLLPLDVKKIIAQKLKNEQDRQNIVNLPDSTSLTGTLTIP